eukprot:scaffold103723_cov63-Phaeocystis_antarctica.AAC.3
MPPMLPRLAIQAAGVWPCARGSRALARRPAAATALASSPRAARGWARRSAAWRCSSSDRSYCSSQRSSSTLDRSWARSLTP